MTNCKCLDRISKPSDLGDMMSVSVREEIEKIFPLVSKPSRYLGNEVNSFRKNIEEAPLKFALAFPDVYEIGMSHVGLRILYSILNRRD